MASVSNGPIVQKTSTFAGSMHLDPSPFAHTGSILGTITDATGNASITVQLPVNPGQANEGEFTYQAILVDEDLAPWMSNSVIVQVNEGL